MLYSFILLTLLSTTTTFAAAAASSNSTNSTTTTTTTSDEDDGPSIDIRFNNTIVTDKTYEFQFDKTNVAYTKGEWSGSKDSPKFKVYVPGIQYVPGYMGYQPKTAEVRFSRCNLGQNQMILYDNPASTDTDNIDLSKPLSESPENAHLITQDILGESNESYYSVTVKPGQCLLVLSYYASFGVDKENNLVISLKDSVTCNVKFVGSEETQVVGSLFMFIGTLIIIILPGLLVVIFGLFIKPREDESKTSVGYQKRLRSSTTCMYIMAFILCFLAFCVLLVVALI